MKKAKKTLIIIIAILLLQESVAIITSKAANEDIFAGVDISAKGDGSVIAKLSQDETTLTIKGTGDMKNFNTSAPWYDKKTKITTVNIGQEVTSIGGRAFSGCSSLTSINIPSRVTRIGELAFSQCRSLRSINIPSRVTRIEDGTFYECSSLRSINIPSGVTSIGDSAFNDCSSLTSINISKGVTSIGERAFSGCNSLTSIEVDSNNTKYMSENGILFNKERTEIIKYPEGKKDYSYNIPRGVTRIGVWAFHKCRNLRSINIPIGVTSIEHEAFSFCSSLTGIDIPNTVTSIGYWAFEGCSSLTSINIPSTVTSIGFGAFSDCNSLTSINIPSGVTSIEGKTFSGCSGLTNIDIPNGVTSIGHGAFSDCNSLTNINIPSGVTSIGYMAFSGCSTLKSINIPSEVTSINIKTFSGCSSLTSINIPSRVTRIGEYAFYGCSSLTSINIPNTVTSIGEKAFSGCKLTIAVSTGEENQEIMPEILARALDKNDILHTTKEFALTNCEMNEAGDKIKINVEIANTKEVSIRVNDGALDGLEVAIIVPSGTITYSTESQTTDNVISTLHIASGETITNNGGSKLHIFTKNGEFTYTYKTKEGEEKTATAKVNNIGSIMVSKYTLENNIIKNIQPNTTYTDFINNINAAKGYVIKEGNTVITKTSIIKTGQVLSIGNDSYVLVVTGDTNGDGKADIKDIMKVNKHRLNKAKLTGVYLTAGDVNNDGKVDIKDIMQINKYRLGKINEI